MKKIIFGVLLLISITLSAQNTKDPSTIPTNHLPQYVEKTVVFKIKPEMRNSILGGIAKNPSLQQIFKEIKISKVEQLFPNEPLPQGRKGVSGKDMIDLSTIYKITYSGNYQVDEVIKNLQKTGLVLYAEPQFIERIFVIPNDPEAQPQTGKQYALENMKAYEAWDIEKGDTNIYVAIIDTDIDIDNPDLKNKVKINYKDPINGIDDDGDSLVDNFRGWDIANWDNDVRPKKVGIIRTVKSHNGGDSTYTDTINGNGHGSMVAGCAAAEVNNGIGVAGTGFNTKFLPIKAMNDTSASSGGIIGGYAGIRLAAKQGCKVINLSWGGGSNYSSFNQDIINYAAINHDVVVVAAAGNDSIEEDFYPGAYENVLSVAASEVVFSPERNKNIDVKAGFGSYSYKVDICAPGRKIYTTYKDNYNYNTGSSFSAPYVAGAAALVRSKFPQLNALQVQEQLRITADVIDTLPENKPFREKFGKGRLNMYRALTDTTMPSIRMYSQDLPDNISKFAYAGDTIRLKAKFKNFLHMTSSLKITLGSSSPYVKFLDSTLNVGKLASLDSFKNDSHPFVFVLSKSIPADYKLILRLNYSDQNYADYQYFQGIINPSFITIDVNKVALTVTSNGRIGFNNASDGQQGVGFVYQDQNLLFEGGLMISNGPTKVSDCVRGNPDDVTDEDFSNILSARYVTSSFATEEIFSEFTEKIIDKVGVEIIQSSYAWNDAAYEKFVILSYKIRNVSSEKIDTLHTGIFADWDIMDSNRNKADWDSTSKLGYVYSTDVNGLFAGISVLSNVDVSCYSLDHSSTAGGDNIFPNDGFTTLEKYNTISKGVFRKAAGGNSNYGRDVSQVVGASVYNMERNEARVINFAIIAGENKTDLIKSANLAKVLSNNINIVTSSTNVMNFEDAISIYPNPTTGIFDVTSFNSGITNVSVLNLLGEEVKYISHPNKFKFEVDLTDQPSGIYIIKAQGDQRTFSGKITKQ